MIFFALQPSHFLDILLTPPRCRGSISSMTRQVHPLFPSRSCAVRFPGGSLRERDGFFTLSRQAHKAEPKNTTAAVRGFVSVIKPSAVNAAKPSGGITPDGTIFRSKV